jgi:hypothetical protein
VFVGWVGGEWGVDAREMDGWGWVGDVRVDGSLASGGRLGKVKNGMGVHAGGCVEEHCSPFHTHSQCFRGVTK